MALPNMAMIPSGYKPTKLYSVLPTPENGSEEVTNGDFATDSDWIKLSGVTISGGMANAPFSSSGNIIRQSSTVLDINKTYRYEFTILNYVSGNIKFAGFIGSANESGNGTYVGYAKPSDINNMVLFGSFEGSIDNVSVKEVIVADADFTVTRATPATRVNQQGLIETPEFIIGGDIITNGDFSDGTTDWTFSDSAFLTSLGAQITTVPSVGYIQQLLALVIGKKYKITYEITEKNSGNLKFDSAIDNSLNTSIGFHSKYFEADTTQFTISRTGSNVDITIDNISVVEVERNNIPRLDYTDGTCPVLLTEPQSTNLIFYSEDFSSGAWTVQSGITLTANTTDVLSPSGLYNANKVVSTDAARGFFYPSLNVTSDATRTIYLKGSVGGETVLIKDSSGFGGSTSHTLTTDWARYEHKTVNDGNTYQGLFVDDISVGTIYAWGAQIEALSYATSYMPTNGSTVTRNQDIVNNAGTSATYNSEEGTFFVECARDSNDGNTGGVQINDGTVNNSLRLFFNQTDTISVITRIGGSNDVVKTAQAITSSTAMNKFALVWKLNDYKLYYNGSELWSDTSANVYPIGTLNVIDFQNQSTPFNGKTSQVQVFNTALSDFDLQNLTSNATAYATYETMRTSLNFNIQ